MELIDVPPHAIWREDFEDVEPLPFPGPRWDWRGKDGRDPRLPIFLKIMNPVRFQSPVGISWLPQFACLLVLTLSPTGQAAEDNGWREHTLAESGSLKAIVKVKPYASMADQDWLILELHNDGPPTRITSCELNGPVSRPSGWSSDSISGLRFGIPSDNDSSISRGNLIPAGMYHTAAPGIRMGMHLGVPSSDDIIDLGLSLDLRLNDGRALVGSLPISTTWTKPSAVQIKSMQDELASLLKKASSDSPLLSTRLYFSPRLTDTENDRLSGLLREPLVSDSLTLPQVLVAVKQRQMDGNFQSGPLMDLVTRRWVGDPALVGFYLEALDVRGEEAIVDLYSPTPGPWDDSFIEPVVQLAERSAKFDGGGSAPGATFKRTITLHRCLAVLDRNRNSWTKDPTISPRLSKAVLRRYPILTGDHAAENPEDRDPKPSGTTSQEFYVALDSIALTRDPAMIPILRPFLRETKLNEYTLNSSDIGMIPMRVCDITANAISRILGGAKIIRGSLVPNLSSKPGETRASDPMSWSRRDHLIAELEQKLDLAPPQ